MSTRTASKKQQESNSKTIWWIIGGVVGLGLIVWMAFSIANDPGQDESIGFGEVSVEGDNLPFYNDPTVEDVAVGLTAPTVSGADWNDNAITIGADGRPKILIFLAHWCPHCQNEVPVVQDWIDGGGLGEDVDMYGLSVLTNRLQGNWPPQDWLEEEGWTVPTIMDDADNTAVTAYGLRGTPFYVVLDGEGTVVARFSGEVGVAGLETMKLLAEQTLTG
ncbi:MAG TPA: TlpA disulfide reductase family protein [Acidimicrobiia bacterium]|nr:TlpA disulfide reductase family protein [Acidimicrobiia bacterium]